MNRPEDNRYTINNRIKELNVIGEEILVKKSPRKRLQVPSQQRERQHQEPHQQRERQDQEPPRQREDRRQEPPRQREGRHQEPPGQRERQRRDPSRQREGRRQLSPSPEAGRAARNRKRRRKQMLRIKILAASIILLLGSVFILIRTIIKEEKSVGVIADLEFITENGKKKTAMPFIEQDYLTPNEYSRSGEKLKKVNNIFVHYTANIETSAKQNRSYFENLKETHEQSASTHFVIGYAGEIIQCLPLDEIGYAVKGHNYDSISIECCYLAEDGSFTRETYDSLIKLTTWLMGKYNLVTEDVLRHYDAGGKLCPLYYANNNDAWQLFKMDLENYIEKNSE